MAKPKCWGAVGAPQDHVWQPQVSCGWETGHCTSQRCCGSAWPLWLGFGVPPAPFSLSGMPLGSWHSTGSSRRSCPCWAHPEGRCCVSCTAQSLQHQHGPCFQHLFIERSREASNSSPAQGKAQLFALGRMLGRGGTCLLTAASSSETVALKLAQIKAPATF